MSATHRGYLGWKVGVGVGVDVDVVVSRVEEMMMLLSRGPAGRSSFGGAGRVQPLEDPL